MGIVATGSMKNQVRENFRSQMPVANAWAYFDHAAVGPLPFRSSQAIQQWAQAACEDGDVRWPEWAAAATQLRSLACQLFHGSRDEVALIPNTTFGVNIVAHCFPWKTGDSVVLLENEFPSNMLPWLDLVERGVEVRKVPTAPDGSVSLDRIRATMDQSTRLVSISWVGYSTGYRVDLAKVCTMVHEAGAKLFVDAIQGLGVFSLNTQEIPIDFAAADGHKWMLGPEGAGLLYIRRSNLESLRPMMTGWGSIESSHEFKSDGAIIKKNASRYEGGSANHVGQIGFSESLQLLLELGCHEDDNNVARAILENADHVREELQRSGAKLTYPRPPQADSIHGHGSGIVSFDVPDHDPLLLRKRLMSAGVVLSVRHHHLRVATHAYNDSSDIERLGIALRSAIAESSTISLPSPS
ncbi:MAG: aminotransferase class V-fold PLP-dependent enzyme [Planctomycetota bacterium]